ncbi:MAG: HNH endonuclease [Candidatus Margulisbacteria bacterium]|nr:HNH endonuclease [Candidatus Margulisiibacteriota bacterium]
MKGFVNYIEEDEEIAVPELSKATLANALEKPIRRTNRHIDERRRFRILMRDGFSCQSCRKSPVKERGVELHVDHITPWSKGGETVDENLQTKCKQCNLGKGTAFDR